MNMNKVVYLLTSKEYWEGLSTVLCRLSDKTLFFDLVSFVLSYFLTPFNKYTIIASTKDEQSTRREIKKRHTNDKQNCFIASTRNVEICLTIMISDFTKVTIFCWKNNISFKKFFQMMLALLVCLVKTVKWKKEFIYQHHPEIRDDWQSLKTAKRW